MIMIIIIAIIVIITIYDKEKCSTTIQTQWEKERASCEVIKHTEKLSQRDVVTIL